MVKKLEINGIEELFNDMADFINFGIVIDLNRIQSILLDPELAVLTFIVGNKVMSLRQIYETTGQFLIPANDRNTSAAINRLRRVALRNAPQTLGLTDATKVLGVKWHTLTNLFSRGEGMSHHIDIDGVSVPLFYGSGGHGDEYKLTEAGVEFGNLLLSFNEYFRPSDRNEILGDNYMNILKIVQFCKEFLYFASSIFASSPGNHPDLSLLKGIVPDEEIDLLKEAFDSMMGNGRVIAKHRKELTGNTIPLLGSMLFAAASFYSRAKRLPQLYTRSEE